MQQVGDHAGASAAAVRIELQPRPMDRGRSTSRGRGAKNLKRASLGPSHSHSIPAHHHHNALLSSDSASPSTPEPSVLPSASRMAHTAPQRGGKARQASVVSTPHRASSPAADQAVRASARTDRPARSATFHSSSFTFDSPSAAGSIMAAAGPSRKRSRTFETPFYDGAAADDEAHSKGGHSLRKRARIDYTQEMIDDEIGLPASKHELTVKPATTPSARSRKRKGAHDESDEDSDGFASTAKRHRADKSPAPARLVASRRRHTSKKPSADAGAAATAYIDQPSDNEVQDTILVSVPNMGPDAPGDDSDQSSFHEAESQPTSSDESDGAPAHAQPPTPQVQPSSSIRHDVSVAADDEVMGKNFIPEGADDEKPPIAPEPIAFPPSSEFEHSGRTIEKEESLQSDLILPSRTAEPNPTTPRFSSQPEQNRTTETTQQQQTPAAPIEKIESSTARDSETVDESAAPPISHRNGNSLSGLLASGLPSRPVEKSTSPARFKQLEQIFESETPFATHLKLTPYEDEDVPLPGPFTEWVYPVEPPKEEPTPISTPASAPTPIEKKATEMEWDSRRRLKTGEFFALYKKEKKRRQEKGEPPISMVEFNNECSRRYKAAHAQDGISSKSSSMSESKGTPTVVVQKASAQPTAIVAQEEVPPNDPQGVESRQPTAAPSPGPVDEAADQEDAVEDEQEAETVADGHARPNGPLEPVEVTRNPSKQYLFPKIREANEFVEAFEGWQDFTTEHLYETVAAAVEAMDAYQREYTELKKLLDDEENAKRRQANDKTIVNWENRQKADEPLHWRRHFDDLIKGPPVFEVRGVRAPKPYIDDPSQEHQKEEDRIMAQAYGFKLNTHPTQVGRQNPEEQRWEMPENRLRKRTEKGAELAEENVVEGKRARKPRYVSDQSKDVSRAGTPAAAASAAVLGPGRRRRRGLAAATGDEPEGQEQTQLTESFGESPRKGRPARSRGTLLPGDQDQIASVAEGDNNQTEDEEDVSGRAKVPRRRGRGAASLLEPPTSAPSEFGGELGKPKRVRGGRGLQAGGEITTSSFYSNASTAATQPDSRPSTASSEGTARTAETAESAYSLRDKRKRNFALENDPELEPRQQRRRALPAHKAETAEPKKRAQRKKEPAAPPPPPVASGPTSGLAALSAPLPHHPVGTKFLNFVPGPASHDGGSSGSQTIVPQAAGPFLHTFSAAPAFPPGLPPPPPPPPSVKKPITKIKLTNNGASTHAAVAPRALTPANGSSSSASSAPGKHGGGGKGGRGNKGSVASEPKAIAPANGSNGGGGGGDFDKPYAEMTKSEKMSWSMRRRWASGEMQGAVEKRRTTLANKKAEKAATTPTGTSLSDSNPMGAGFMTTDPNSAGPSGPATPVSMHGQPPSAFPAPPPSAAPVAIGLAPSPLALPQGGGGPPPLLLQPAQPAQPHHLQGYLQQPPPYTYPFGPTGPTGPL